MNLMIACTLIVTNQNEAANKELELTAKTVLALPTPASLGVFRAEAQIGQESKFVSMSKPVSVFSNEETLATRSKELFGRVLPDFWKHRFWRRQFGDLDSNPGAVEMISVAFFPSKEHAYLNALGQMINGVQSTKWPKPAFPEITSKETRYLGDKVWALKTSSSMTIVAIANRTVMHFQLSSSTAKDSHKIPFTSRAKEEWDAYLTKVVEKVRACPLNK